MKKICISFLLAAMLVTVLFYDIKELALFVSPFIVILCAVGFTHLQTLLAPPTSKQKKAFVLLAAIIMLVWSVGLLLLKEVIQSSFILSYEIQMLWLMVLLPYISNFFLLYFMYNDNWRLQIFNKKSKLSFAYKQKAMTMHYLGNNQQLTKAVGSINRTIKIMSLGQLDTVQSINFCSPLIDQRTVSILNKMISTTNKSGNITLVLSQCATSRIRPYVRLLYFIQFGLLTPRKWKYFLNKAFSTWNTVEINRATTEV